MKKSKHQVAIEAALAKATSEVERLDKELVALTERMKTAITKMDMLTSLLRESNSDE